MATRSNRRTARKLQKPKKVWVIRHYGQGEGVNRIEGGIPEEEMVAQFAPDMQLDRVKIATT